MPSSVINSDDGVISGTSGLKSSGGDDGVLNIQNNGTTAVTVNASGNVGIGTSTTTDAGVTITKSVTRDNSWDAKLALQSTGTNDFPALLFSGCSATDRYGAIVQTASTSGNTGQQICASIDFPMASATTCNMVFSTNGNIGTTGPTERARITSGGYFKATSTGSYSDLARPFHEFRTAALDDWILRLSSTNASPYGLNIQFTGGSPNNNSNDFIGCSDSTTTRFQVRSNGGIANFSGNNVNLSDRREKINFAPAKNYLETICAIPVQTFNYIDQNLENDSGLTLGVVAQDVQEVAPELVMESNWANKDEEPKMRLSIYQTDLQYALMKCIQELSAKNDALEARIAALEAVPGNE